MAKPMKDIRKNTNSPYNQRKTRSNWKPEMAAVAVIDAKKYVTGKGNALSAKQIDQIAFWWRQQLNPTQIAVKTGFSVHTVKRYIGFFERDAALGTAPALQAIQERVAIVEDAYLRSDCLSCQTEIVYLKSMPVIMCHRCKRTYDRSSGGVDG